jgi:hypothetical protein
MAKKKTNMPKLALKNLTIEGDEKKFAIVSSAIAISICSLFTLITVLSQGQNGELRNFFSAQAYSILNGSFEVDKSKLPGECYIFEGKCIGYFGVTLSLLRIPLLIFGENFGFTSSSVIAAIILGVIVSTLILYQITKIMRFWSLRSILNTKLNYVLLLLIVSLGSIFLQLTRPSAFWEAISWGSTLTLFGVFLILKWYQDLFTRYLLGALACFILAANTRITHGLIAFAVGFVCLMHLRYQDAKRKTWQVSFAAAIMVLPLITSLGVMYIKFNSFFPNLLMHEQIPEAQHWGKILENNGGKTVGLVFFLTNLLTYLRPDSLVLSNQFDLISVRPSLIPVTNVYPLPEGGMNYEPSASITNLMPISVMMLIYVFVVSRKSLGFKGRSSHQEFVDFKFIRDLSISSLFGLIITLTFVMSSNRYLGDFIPASVLFATLGLIVFMKSKRYQEDKFYLLLIFVVIILGVISNLLSIITRVRLGIL